jgi:hypothetical protein
MTGQDHQTAEGGLDPFQALTRLSHAITAIDHLLAERAGERDIQKQKRRIIYARNTLVVALQLWQSDLIDRFVQSRGGFYVYCMLDAEKLAFLRRMRPALSFTAEELRALNLAALDHVIPLVDQAAEDAAHYATENRQSLIIAKSTVPAGVFPDIISHKTMTLAADEEIFIPSDVARTG